MASRLWAICTDHSAFWKLPAPKTVHVPDPLAQVPCSLTSLVWYQATSTRPPLPATIQGNVLVPALAPEPVIRCGADQVSAAGFDPAGSSEWTT